MKVKMIASAVACVALAFTSSADGRDGLVHWWKVKDLNGDGLVQAQEVYDVMTVGAEKPLTAEYVYQSTDTQAGAKPVAIVNDVYLPTMRRNADDGAMRFYSPTNYAGDGTLKINYQSIKLPKAATVGSYEATVVARVKWDGARFKQSGNYNYAVNIYANNYNDNAGSASGWRVGLRCCSSENSYTFHPMFTYGNQEIGFHHGKFSPNAEYPVTTNVWYDMVYSFRRKVENGATNIYASALYRKGEVEAANMRHFYMELPAQKYTTTWKNFGTTSYFSHIGFHTGNSGNGGRDDFISATRDDCFPGLIHELKIYNRHMSELEMLQCLGGADPLCSIGSKNGSADEFSDTDAAEVFEPETMPWGRMRRTLNAGNPSVSIKCAIEPHERNLPRLMEMRFLKDGGFVGDSVRLDMNGSKVGRLNIPTDGIVRFFIPAAKFARLAVDEESGKCPAVFTLTRKGGFDGDIRFDALSIDGAWQLGTADNAKAEFAQDNGNFNNYVYHVGQNDIAKAYPNVFGASSDAYRNFDLHFTIGEFLSANCDYKFIVKSCGNNGGALKLYLNDMTNAYLDFAVNEMGNAVTSTIPAGTFSSGGNMLRLSHAESGNEHANVWVSFDYFRLEPVVPEGWRNSDDGMTLKVR